jgi:2,4-dienoyl-CoA reductase-like NADH-dependent reductase (Old Yellow Enzyme family)
MQGVITMQSTVFEKANLAGIPMKNRIIRSATHEGMANETGLPTEALKKAYLKLAKGGVGAIITGYAGIQQDGKSPLLNMLMMDSDACIDTYRQLVKTVHEQGTPIILQVAHCGRQTISRVTGRPTVAPSSIRDKFYTADKPRELSIKSIEEIIDNFVHAIKRAKEAGFDGAELHAAHGYLLAQFLSPYMNRRSDAWGGSLENRFRIVGEIYRCAREEVGDFPILIKINAHDGRRNGMQVDEAVRIAHLLESAGCSAIEVSCGVVEDGFYSTRGEHTPIDAILAYNYKFKNIPGLVKKALRPFADIVSKPVKPLKLYNVEAARSIKQNVSIPVIVVGGISNLDDIETIIGNGSADFVSMSRPFIIEPDIVKKFQVGKQKASKCIACNYCIIAAEEKPLQCYYGRVR